MDSRTKIELRSGIVFVLLLAIGLATNVAMT